MIGPNDFCLEYCYVRSIEEYNQRHKQDLIKVFRYLRDNLPRTFVNLVMAPSE